MGKVELHIPRPQPKQLEFMRSKTKYTGYGGARGGGKSWAVRTNAILLALKHHGIRQLIVRRTYPELVNNHIRILRTQLRDIARYNDKEKIFTFRGMGGTPSTIQFAYCARDQDLDRLQGTEYDVIYLDEATQLTEYQMKSIVACLRGVNDFPKRVYMTANPGGQGHAWYKRLFIDRKYMSNETAEDYSFIQALVTDNAALMASNEDYIKQLEALPPKIRDAWLYGSWDVYEGQFFEEFRDDTEGYDTHQWSHVITQFNPPKGWTYYRSFDWGYNHPFSCGWYAVDYDGVMYRIAELYGCTKEPNTGVKWTADRVFREIANIEKTHPFLVGRRITGVADPAIWQQNGGESIAETAIRCGVLFTKGDHSRVAGWMQCHYRLQQDENGYSNFYCFSSCPQFIRTIPTLCYDDHKVEDLDTDGEDHIADEWRYVCMARPIKPVVPAEPQPVITDPLNQLKRRRR